MKDKFGHASFVPEMAFATDNRAMHLFRFVLFQFLDCDNQINQNMLEYLVKG